MLVDTYEDIPVRALDKGMGLAVARRTVFRPSDQEDMRRVADRVAMGNTMLSPETVTLQEFHDLRAAISRGALPTSGRHLQHGDTTQIKRNMEIFTNCASAAASFSKFYLLLNGSGVGRSVDDDLMVVDWDYAPKLKLVLSPEHKDFPFWQTDFYKLGEESNLSTSEERSFETSERIKAWFFDNVITPEMTEWTEDTVYHEVADSREGWAKALEIYEAMAFRKENHKTLVLDFCKVRPNGSPIGGMQNRPASGPISIMRAFMNVREFVVGKGMPLWMQTMFVDHYFSVEVQVGGARRAARITTKRVWDKGILEFIQIKMKHGLWTSNNSVMVDEEFWELIDRAIQHIADGVELNAGKMVWAWKVFQMVTECSYYNGEPGFVNGHKLESHRTGKSREKYTVSFQSDKYQIDEGRGILEAVAERAVAVPFAMTLNPCGEVELHVLGAYCVIGDLAPLNDCPIEITPTTAWDLTDEQKREWDTRFLQTVRLGTRFLMRVNQMNSLYQPEVRRTERIGVSLTGIHEFAWTRFGYTFLDLINEEKSKSFWNLINAASVNSKVTAELYASSLGVEVPHTVPTIKPAGTTSKLWALTEGAHLPARRQYIRWVQYRGHKQPDGAWPADADPLLAYYEAKGYPIKRLNKFNGMSVIGFPTIPMICRLMPSEQIVTAPEATPEQQFQWLRLLEKYWIGADMGNQISYTMKIYTDKVGLEEYRGIIARDQPTIRCCAILPSKPDHEMGYEYLPEEEVNLEEFNTIVSRINDDELKQGIDLDTLLCASGACPI